MNKGGKEGGGRGEGREGEEEEEEEEKEEEQGVKKKPDQEGVHNRCEVMLGLGDNHVCALTQHPLRLIRGKAGRASGKVVIRDLDPFCAACLWWSQDVR